MGSCLSKKDAKKRVEEPQQPAPKKPASPKLSAELKAPLTSPSVPQPVAAAPLTEKPPPSDDEAVKEILSETSMTTSKPVEVKEKEKEKLLTELPSEPAVKKSNSLKKKGSFKKDQADKAPEGGVARSSSAKEDVDAILIQCGRLSRSSSGRAGTASTEGGVTRQYSGSKRHAAEDEQENGKESSVRRPSHRRAPTRDFTAAEGGGSRSGSRERANSRQTGRRISPSPGRRSENQSTEKSRPGNSGRTASKRVPAVKRGSNSGEIGKTGVNTYPATSTTSRSRSPAPRVDGFPQSLSRSSSRKAEQSPFRRPAGDENPAVAECKSEDNKIVSSSSQISDENGAVKREKRVALKEINGNVNGNSNSIRDQLLTCRAAPALKEVTEEAATAKLKRKPSDANGVCEVEGFQFSVEEEQSSQTNGSLKADGVPLQFARSRSSRRSRDQFLLDSFEDAEMKGFPLPASVSKAQSILEAVADLNSSVNSNSSVKSVASDSVEQGKSARFISAASFGAEEKEILREFQRNVSGRNSNAEWPDPEDSAGSRLSAARLHRYEEDFPDSAKVASKNENADENEKVSASLKQNSARYFNISPEDVLMNPYLGIKSSESSSRSNLMPVITLGKKEFHHSKRANSVQNGRAFSEQSKQNHQNSRVVSDLDLKANSRVVSDPGAGSRGNTSFVQ